ncbi:response regulator [Desulfopila sp. IMCC35008]|uniref:hybrid sensor histidine kinase/response regulator n=1 Tax=Desulfopila sp. IMCC35008 TaxID=2653858 RepID=UPI0013D4CDEF|nr:response regulator [Desulfopila sp. IMCC35008]
MKIAVIMKVGSWRNKIVENLYHMGWQPICFDSAQELFCSIDQFSVPDILISELRMDDVQAQRDCYLLRSADLSCLHSVPWVMVSHLYSHQHGGGIARSMGADSYVQLKDTFLNLTQEIEDLANGVRAKANRYSALFIEDDPVLRRMVVNKFTLNHWQIETAVSVAIGSEKLAQKRYDLVVIDYHLPDGKGDGLLPKIATDYPDTTTIMVTCDTQPELSTKWLEMGASAYLLKPFSPSYLYETATRCIRENMWISVELELEERSRRLNEREALVKDFEDFVGEVLWQRNLDFRYKYCSPSIRNIIGYSVEEYQGFMLEDEMTPDSAVRFRELLTKALGRSATAVGRRQQYRLSVELYHKDGGTRTVDISFVIKDDVAGVPVTFVGTTKDVSDRKDKEEQFDFLHSAISQADDVILVTDAKGRLEFANESFTRVTGYEPEEWIGTEKNILTSGAQDDSFYLSLWSTITTGRNWTGQLTNRRKDGTFFQEKAKITPIRNSSNEIIRFVAVKHDLSHELEIANEKEEIEKKYLQTQRLEAIGVLAAGISHDFNNILTPIVGYANLIKMRYAKDALIQDHISQILIAGERAKELVRQILAFSRGKEKKQESIYLVPLIKESIKMIRSFLPPKISISHDIDGDFPTVLIDPTRFSQLFMNIVTNSFQAMESSGGTITIGLQKSYSDSLGPVLQMSVTDTGQGIPADISHRVFEAFFTTKEEGKGTGLGLSVCKDIVEESGGRIEVAFSSPLRGTSILVSWPVLACKEVPRPDQTLQAKRFDGKGRRVLLVDDDTIVLNYLSTALQRLNFVVDSYADSQEALQEILKGRTQHSLFFTDIEMPNKDGYQIIKGIRKVNNEVPIIVCTGDDETEVEAALNKEECLEFLRKPATVGDISVALSKLFVRKGNRETMV